METQVRVIGDAVGVTVTVQGYFVTLTGGISGEGSIGFHSNKLGEILSEIKACKQKQGEMQQLVDGGD